MAYLLYQLALEIRGTRAAPVFLGLFFVAILYQLSALFGFQTIHWLIETLIPYTALAMVVIFQAEIRRTLRQLALNFVPRGRPKQVTRSEYEDVVFAVAELAEGTVGALVVLERETGLRTFVQSGVVLDANLTSDLLISIFQQSSPLHDGAVIIRRGKVAAAACFLPLTTNPELVSSLGTRHRAAIGITEESDCMAIVVSEVSGRISIASAGSIDQGVTLDRLRLRMIQHFGPVVSAPHGKPLALARASGEPLGEPVGDLATTSTSASEGD